MTVPPKISRWSAWKKGIVIIVCYSKRRCLKNRLHYQHWPYQPTFFFIFLVANHQPFENCRSWGEAKLSLSRQFGHTKSCFIFKHSNIGNSYRKKVTQRNGLLNGYHFKHWHHSHQQKGHCHSGSKEIVKYPQNDIKFIKVLSYFPLPTYFASPQHKFVSEVHFRGGPLKSLCFPPKKNL